MASIFTVIAEDGKTLLDALAALAPAATPVAGTPAPPMIVSVATVETQIDAVSFSSAMSALASLATSASNGASALPAGAIVAAEDFAGLVDPELIPLIAAARIVLPMVQLGLGLLADGTAAVNTHPVGTAGSKPTGIV